ncbi:hypothetical protein GCM10017044_15270 [Kordiimonas sediminis]|uniref:Integrase n=2 Tax=Kordiimonas sediminis TaxID=1735581 RepID=A0A919ARY5_9PROT|nr:hypothetical protein GCM10017044_15270 [Kordiimonas sediminis]
MVAGVGLVSPLRVSSASQRAFGKTRLWPVLRGVKSYLPVTKLKDITKANILKLHEKHGDIPYQANRTRGVLSKMFNYAEDLELRPDNSNPVLKVKPYPEKKRDRYLSPEELKALGKTLKSCEETGTESPYMIAAIKLLILTGCRLGEIQTLK